MEQMTTLSWEYMPKQLDNLLIWWNDLWLDIRTYINIHNQVFARKHQFPNFVIHYWRFIGQNETVPSHNHHILRNITRFWETISYYRPSFPLSPLSSGKKTGSHFESLILYHIMQIGAGKLLSGEFHSIPLLRSQHRFSRWLCDTINLFPFENKVPDLFQKFIM